MGLFSPSRAEETKVKRHRGNEIINQFLVSLPKYNRSIVQIVQDRNKLEIQQTHRLTMLSNDLGDHMAITLSSPSMEELAHAADMASCSWPGCESSSNPSYTFSGMDHWL